jgi:hypothetical protein
MLDGSGTPAVPSTSKKGRVMPPLEDHGPALLPIKLNVTVPMSLVEFFHCSGRIVEPPRTSWSRSPVPGMRNRIEPGVPPLFASMKHVHGRTSNVLDQCQLNIGKICVF